MFLYLQVVFFINICVMAKRTPIEQQEVDCQLKALLKLILKKTGISYNDMIRSAEQDFITANLEYVSDEEKKQFDKLIFANNDKEAASFAFVR